MRFLALYPQSYGKVINGRISDSGDEVSADIRSFSFLSHGWNFGAGDPIKADIIEKALTIHNIGIELGLLTEATPEVNGDVTLTFVHGEDAVDIRIHSDHTYTVTHERGIGIIFDRLARKKRVSMNEALSYLYQLKPMKVEYIPCESCEFLAQEQSAKQRNVLKQNLALLTTQIAFQSSTWTVFA